MAGAHVCEVLTVRADGAHSCCAGNWEARWPLKDPETPPWTHGACRPGLPLRHLRATSDLPEPQIPLDTALATTFFRQALLRASAGCRVAAQARTFALIERAGHYNRVQLALSSGKGTAVAAEMAALDRAAAELLGGDGMYEATLAKRRFERATQAMHAHGVDPLAARAAVGEEYGGDGTAAADGGASGGRGEAAGTSAGAAVPHARVMHGMHVRGQPAFGPGSVGGDCGHSPGWRGAMGVGQRRAGTSGGAADDGRPGRGQPPKPPESQGWDAQGNGSVGHEGRGCVATGGLAGAAGGARPETQAGQGLATGDQWGSETGRDGKGGAGVYSDGWHTEADHGSTTRGRHDGADLGPTADLAQPDGLSVAPDQGGISTALRHVAPASIPLPPQPGRKIGRRSRARPASVPGAVGGKATAVAQITAGALDGSTAQARAGRVEPQSPELRSVWDAESDDDSHPTAKRASEGSPAGPADREGGPGQSTARRRAKAGGSWRPRWLQEGALSADMRDDLNVNALWRRSQGRLASPHSRRDRTMRHTFPQHATGFHAV